MFVPYKRFTIDIFYDVDEVINKLSQHIRSSKPVISDSFSRDRRMFVGEVSGNEFKVVRNVSYLNSFLPEIRGIFEPSHEGTKVKISMVGNLLVLVTFVSVFAFIAFFVMTIGQIVNLSNNLLLLFTFAGGFIGYLFCNLMFVVNMSKDKKYLLEILGRQH